jgi:hypothetical protein
MEDVMMYRGDSAMSALSIAAALVVLIVALGIIGWSGGWFGSRAPEVAPAATTTE